MADLKTLRVCLSSELPAEKDRLSNYIYFTYDTLTLYLGQNEFYDNFNISESFPTSPVNGRIYLLTSDGSVHRYIDYTDTKLAEIENVSQIELLKGAGTTFSINASRRYLDSQLRTITLPFNNGLYELAVSARNDQVFNNNTILKYNVDKEKFEIYGESGEEYIDFSKPFRGGTTSTVIMKVDGSRLQGNVRLSKVSDNILRATSDGIFAKVTNKVDKSTYDEFYSSYMEFKLHAKDVLANLSDEIKVIQSIVSEEAVNQKIYAVLEAKFENIQEYLDNYAALYTKMEELETSLFQYADTSVSTTRSDILNKISWNDLDEEEYESDVDYYAKAKEYYTRPDHPTEKEIQLIIAAAVQMFRNEENN